MELSVSAPWFALEEGRIGWDRFRLLIPGYGRVIRHRYYAQFARTLGTLMENGVPLLRSLDLVTEIAGNRFLEVKLGEVRRAVIDGATLSAALQQQKLFPDLFTDMMAVGEQTGHFAETMQAIADVYERELDRSVGVISQLIPPVIIVIIALLVGLVVLQHPVGGLRNDAQLASPTALNSELAKQVACELISPTRCYPALRLRSFWLRPAA